MTLRRNRATRALTSLGLAVAMTAALAGIVAAHHADISAQMDCDGVVTFTSTAWNGPTNASRTNPDIGVWYSVDGGPFTELLNVDYFFGPDHFSFTDSLELPGATFVTIKVRAQANWGNGTAPGDARQATAFAPNDCVEEPTPTPTPTATPVVTTTISPPVVTPTPQAASTPRQGTLGGNPTLPNTSAEMGDQGGALLVAAGMVLLLGVTQLVRERRERQRLR
jgi:hypothetical protein